MIKDRMIRGRERESKKERNFLPIGSEYPDPFYEIDEGHNLEEKLDKKCSLELEYSGRYEFNNHGEESLREGN